VWLWEEEGGTRQVVISSPSNIERFARDSGACKELKCAHLGGDVTS